MNKVLNIPQDIFNEFFLRYTADEMRNNLNGLMRNFLKNNEDLCLSEGLSPYTYSKVHDSHVKKEYIVKLYCTPFLSEKLVDAFRKFLPSETRAILDELVWKGQLHEDEIREDLGIEVVDEVPARSAWESPQRTINEKFKFFLAKSKHIWQGNKGKVYTLTLLPAVLKYLRINYPKPKNYNLNSAKLKKTDFVYTAEKDIFFSLR